ncbi:glycosyltransferase family 2 protein [Cyclobacterium plantarum]|uniref:Glycosyltransferase family 2 protein n=1 Tax=Cyclobacterium plantarum TaxID=2716263 RepID=A0ABX0H7D3_9BACT|nr:glycosyltransferase family 2 protein [Cyclobacterium plantarum]NHE56254.1 glycosyltransferase family 2 protein [Cyclobacterium plantarum]
MTKESNTYLSVVVPVYQSDNSLEALITRLRLVLAGISTEVELILVDDHSSDRSWELICAAAETFPDVSGIRLSRNFGQHHAIAAGLDAARGKWTVVMDADLQDLPEEIPHLLSKARHGYDVVMARRTNRKDEHWKIAFSAIFYRFFRYMTGTRLDPAVGNFGIYHRKVIRAISEMREAIRYFPAQVQWVGFRQGYYNVAHGKSAVLQSGYGFRSRFHLGLNALLAYSDKPLRLTIKLGFFIASIGFIFALVTLIRYFSGLIVIPGYASLIVSLWVLSGLVLMTMGMVGLYVGKTFEGVKNRPLYIIDQKT